MKHRIRWIYGKGWTILTWSSGPVGFDDLSTAYDVAVGKRWMTPRRSDMTDALAYGLLDRRGSGNAPFFSGVDHAAPGSDRTVRYTQDGTIIDPRRDPNIEVQRISDLVQIRQGLPPRPKT